MTTRTLALHGAVNIRDLGGLPAADGRQVQSRRLLRSDSLAGLNAMDVSTLLDELGLGLIIDLRAPGEVERDGRGPLAEEAVRFVNLPLQGAAQTRLDLSAQGSDGDLAVHYAGYLEHSAEAIVSAVRLLADEDTSAAVVHCAAGKDRTGVLVAVVLDAIGVAHEEIVADYAATAANMELVAQRLQSSPSFQLRTGPPVPAWVFAAEPQTMRSFLGHLAENGGAATWLLENGLSAAELDALVFNLLGPDLLDPNAA
jgi:protein-tyrosine phosphatase